MALLKLLSKRGAHLLHVLRLRSRGVPAVVQDEDVWAGQALAHLVEELLFLDEGKNLSEGRAVPAKALLAHPLGWILGVILPTSFHRLSADYVPDSPEHLT